MTNLSRSLIIGTSVLALAACGPESIGSPGAGNVEIIVEAPSPTPTPTSTSLPATIPAGACPTLTNDGSVELTDAGTLGDGRGGSWRLCNLPNVITKSITLPKVAGLLYVLNGRTDVGCDGGFVAPTAGSPHATTTVGCPTANLTADTNVTLTIQPGVKVIGGTGQSWLAVNRGNKINAAGTAADPIIFTSRQNAAGINADSTPGGQWGGVVLMGRAQVTNCNGSAPGTTPGVDCQRQTEGSPSPAIYGGGDDTYNAGTMRYVQIRYSGFILGSGSELQALTPEAVGSGTTLEFIQTHRSSDDGIEFFGGQLGMKNVIITGADDDSLDVDVGARIDMQNVLLLQVPGEGDGLFEIDSNGSEAATPRTRLRVSNLLGYQPQTSANNESSGNTNASLLLRGNSDTTIYNSAIISPNNQCIRMTANAADAANNATLTARSLVLQCSGSGDAKFIGDGTGATPFTPAAVRALITGNSSNNEAFVNTLTNGFVNGTAENGVTTTDPTTLSSTFFAASPTPFRIGAAWTENSSWYTGWTCSATYANFGTAPCTQLVG